MVAIPYQRVSIQDVFWSPRLLLNNQVALLHQWNQLELSGCIQNFRILEAQAPGFRTGWFFADSDAYKWLEAASHSIATIPNTAILSHMNDLIDLIHRAQTHDGYLFTYNQIHFPQTRWQNLQIEHELYCHGHLIEAGISHHLATNSNRLLAPALKAANLICATFLGSGLEKTPGHEEIEIALIHLYDLTTECRYIEMAEQFLEKRGRQSTPVFAWRMIQENANVKKRSKIVAKEKASYLSQNPDAGVKHQLPPKNQIKPSRWANQRFLWSGLTGTYFQQKTPIRYMHEPIGHAVRFAYLQTAVTMYTLRYGEYSLWSVLRDSWVRMIEKRMYVTGGTGSLPVSEAFGRDYELDPSTAYAETCAALGTMFWNWEMTQLFNEAAFSDLFERQLYNAALVGIGLSGDCYLYNNPLENKNGFKREPWFEIPCCPSNLSRTLAALGQYIYTYEKETISIHQYISNTVEFALEKTVSIEIESNLPWNGNLKILVSPESAYSFDLILRVPSWCGKLTAHLNGFDYPLIVPGSQNLPPTAVGYDPRTAQNVVLKREWSPGDILELDFSMPIEIQKPHPKVRSCTGKYAITRGPIVYCLEGIDNPGVDIFDCVVDPHSLIAEHDPELLSGITKITGKTTTGQALVFIPYAWWANRDPCPMTVYVKM